jgi:hypothetical protein
MRLEELFRLADVIEIEVLQMLQNIETCWFSLIDSIRRFLAEYQIVLGKAHVDRAEAIVNFHSQLCLAFPQYIPFVFFPCFF